MSKKMTYSLSLDSELVTVIDKISKGNVSKVLNRILRNALMTEEGLKSELQFYEEEIHRIKSQYAIVTNTDKTPSEALRNALRKHLDILENKDILTYLPVRTRMINEVEGTAFKPEIVLEMLKREAETEEGKNTLNLWKIQNGGKK